MVSIESLRRWLLPSCVTMIAATWIWGGVTADSTSADEGLQLLAIPIAAFAACLHTLSGVPSRWTRAALLVACLVAAVPLLQLVGLPMHWWEAAPARRALAADLHAVGVGGFSPRWTLTPDATEKSLWSLLPAFAAFLAALALDAGQRRIVVGGVLLLTLANVAFAFFQVALPLDSRLRLYTAIDSRFGGLFANTNHQAIAMVVAMTLAAGQGVHAWHRGRAGRGMAHAWLVYAFVAIACLVLLPLTTSRAGMVIALPVLAATLVLCGAIPLRKLRHNRWLFAFALAAALVAMIGIKAGLGWMRVDEAEDLRHGLSAAARGMAMAESPWGAGVGGFRHVFEQAAPPRFWLPAYVNHAHNEYVQWWLEAGWLGLCVIGCTALLLAAALWRVVTTIGRDGHAILAASCLMAIIAAMVHSWGDYPLRTTALMTTLAAIAGVMFGALGDIRPATSREHAAPAVGRTHVGAHAA